MEKGQGKGTDTLQTDNVFTRKEYIEREAVYYTLAEYYHHSTDTQHMALREALSRVPAADVVPAVRCGECRFCGIHTKQTNADRIRAMTDEELDRFLSGVHNNVGSGRAQIAVWNNSDRPIRIWRTGWLDWLKQECEK